MSKFLRWSVSNRLGRNTLRQTRHLLMLALFLTASQVIYAQLNITFNVQEPTCFGLPNGKVKALVSGGFAPYTYQWNTGATVAQLDGIAAGTYTVTITDAAGSTAVNSVTINQPALVTADISSSASCSSPFTLTAVGGGGAPPYKYYWTTNQTSQSIVVSAGTYCVTLTDQNSCGAVKCITVNPTPLTLSAVATGVNCPNGQDGTVTANPVGGTAPFTYTWSNGGNTQTISNLTPGTYSVTVSDSKGCSATASATVANKTPIVISIITTQPTCATDSTGILTASVSGGTPPYTYAWSNGATTQTITGLGAGTYTVTITDNKGCKSSKSIDLQPKSKLKLTVSGNNESCPDLNNGSITANPTNGVPPYAYAWSNSATTQTITNLTPGTYTVTVTDFVGCKATTSFTVTEAINLTLVVNKKDIIGCGGNNGAAKVTVTSGVPPYNYKWSNNATTDSISNLGAGKYKVTVTDARGCTKIDSVTLTAPPPVFVSVNAKAFVCPGATNGTAKATASGGTAPFSYLWSNGATTDSISNLGAGAYRVTVTDANGCMASAADTILTSPQLNATISAPAILCGANTTSATVQVAGGVPPYKFLWNTGVTTQTILGLTAGGYKVTVTDTNGCTDVDSITITSVNIIVNIIKKDILCFGVNAGTAKATATGGTAPYTYAWSNGATLDSVSNLAAGTYTVTVTDKNGCKGTQTVTITQPTSLTINLVGDSLVCPSDSASFVKVTATGGTAPYSFKWNTNATTDSIGNLPAGTYTVTVTDANGCQKTGNFIIKQSPSIIITINATAVVCGAENTGMATATVSGGRAPYTYQWSNGKNGPNLEDLITGTYRVTVTDANGCSAIKETTVKVVSDFAITAVPRNVLCNGDNSGSILVAASGGATPYIYAWSTGSTATEVVNLIAGIYSVTVTDNNGCKLSQTMNITQPTALTVTATKANVNCFSSNNGTATINVTGGTTPYTFKWSNNASTQNLANLAPGTYTVTVTDANFCTKTAAVTITQPTQLTANINATNINCFGSSTGSATVATTGGTAPYLFKWSNNATTQSISSLAVGTYIVTVTDASQCSALDTVVITQPTALQVALTVNNIVCTSQQIGAITALPTGGTGPYTYKWNNNATTAAINNLPAGSYTVTVTDAKGCSTTATSGVAQVPNLSISVNKEDVSCFGTGDGLATVTVTGDVAPYRFKWSNGDTTATADNLVPGTYTVTVTGNAGCTGTISTTITQPTALVLQLSKVDVSCNTGNTGKATATVSGGKTPYSYSWSNGGNTASISNLTAGKYQVTVTDANECSKIDSVTIAQPNLLTVTVTITKGTCDGDKSGNIATTVAGGTAPYSYKWSSGQTTASLSNVGAGTYTVTVTDAKGCTTNGSATLTAFKKPSCSITLVNDSTAQVVVTGGTAPYTYQWSNNQFTDIIKKLQIGTYSVTVTDANGCTTSCAIEIKGPALIGDFVWLDLDFDGIQDAGEPGIKDVIVILSGAAESTPYSDTTKTNANGIYQFQVPPPGTYKVTFILPPGSGLKPTTQNAGSDDAKDSDADPITLMTQFVTVKKGDVNLTLDAGFHEICQNINNAGVIGYDQYLCGPGNDPAPIVEVTAPSGGAGPIEYLWMKSTIGGPFNNTNWEPIPNSNTKNYNPDPVYETTYFIRCTRRADCPYIETNIVTVVVGNETVAEIQGSNLVCEDTPVTFKAGGIGASFNYKWDLGPAAIPRYITGQTANVTFSSFGTFEIKLTVTQGNCTSTILKRITVSSLCSGLNIDVTALNDVDVKVQWKVKDDGQNYQFVVEHSSEGTDFQQIGQVLTPTKVSAGFKYYEEVSPAPKRGWNYYRVMVVDQQGKKSYSEIESLVMYANSELMHYYPNPVTNRLTVEIFDSLNGEVEFQVVSPTGIVLQTIMAPKDATRQDLDFSDLPTGPYFVKVKYGNIDVKVLKVLKN